MPSLDDLGKRICIFGPSSSGKSTLAVAIGLARGLPVIHLDLLRHLPNTDWARRPDHEFAALHEEAIAGESWVIEGNYSHLTPLRWRGPPASSCCMQPGRCASCAICAGACSTGPAPDSSKATATA